MKQIQIQPCGDPVTYLNQVKYVIEGRIIMKYLPVFSSIHLVSLFIHLSIREKPLIPINAAGIHVFIGEMGRRIFHWFGCRIYLQNDDWIGLFVII